MRYTVLSLVSLALLLLGVACPRAEQAASSSGTESAAPVTAAQEAAAIVPLTPSEAPFGGEARYLRSSDGYYVAAWYWAPREAGAPGVILLHMRGRSKSSWGDFPEKLVAEGFAAVAIDLRGHGETLDPGGRGVELNDLKDSDYRLMLNDVAAAHQLLAGEEAADETRIALVGASIGANLAIMYAAGNKYARTAVALSPGLNYKSLEPKPYLEAYGERALYLIAAEGDKYSHESCLELEQASKADPVSYRHFAGSEHGTNLLSAHEGLDMTIISGWLLNHLPPER
jgi:dienelactone hydrolase